MHMLTASVAEVSDTVIGSTLKMSNNTFGFSTYSNQFPSRLHHGQHGCTEKISLHLNHAHFKLYYTSILYSVFNLGGMREISHRTTQMQDGIRLGAPASVHKWRRQAMFDWMKANFQAYLADFWSGSRRCGRENALPFGTSIPRLEGHVQNLTSCSQNWSWVSAFWKVRPQICLKQELYLSDFDPFSIGQRSSDTNARER